MTHKKFHHIFVVCAYGESPYLEECIQSLQAQTRRSPIFLVTSTDNDYIRGIAEEYRLHLRINRGETGIAGDWNFGYREAAKLADFVTIAHQDDVYAPDYARRIMIEAKRQRHPLILFSDYAELRDDDIEAENTLLRIKRLMLLPLRLHLLQQSVWVRRRILSLGNPISCPAVTYCTKNLPEQPFKTGFKSNVDWEAWECISKSRGSFAYIPEPLMYHRIHEDSTTSELIQDDARWKEDYAMFRKFWPEWMAKLLIKPYRQGEKLNGTGD